MATQYGSVLTAGQNVVPITSMPYSTAFPGAAYGVPVTTSIVGAVAAAGPKTVPVGTGEENAAEGTPLSPALCAQLGVPVGTLWGAPAGTVAAPAATSPSAAACTSLKQFPDIEDADKVICAKRSPIPIDVEEGKTYYWCTCGRSKNQPFCDGSHAGTKFQPQPYQATKSEKKYFCACKQTANAPFCDGAHTKIAADMEGKALPNKTVDI